ncbi:hypothetical protein EDD85DRAFT_962849 [Armillaria nabsnona]|nr:hypothetical protein EDD85DRAFT_962849 [Armillaria nabsnona]
MYLVPASRIWGGEYRLNGRKALVYACEIVHLGFDVDRDSPPFIHQPGDPIFAPRRGIDFRRDTSARRITRRGLFGWREGLGDAGREECDQRTHPDRSVCHLYQSLLQVSKHGVVCVQKMAAMSTYPHDHLSSPMPLWSVVCQALKWSVFLDAGPQAHGL